MSICFVNLSVLIFNLIIRLFLLLFKRNGRIAVTLRITIIITIIKNYLHDNNNEIQDDSGKLHKFFQNTAN